MVGDTKAVIAGHHLLEGFNAVVFELHNFSTSRTDQVVVMPAWSCRLIAYAALSKATPSGESSLRQEFDGPRNRCIADPRVLFLDLVVELLGTDMTPFLEKSM